MQANHDDTPLLSLVVPFYNEGDALHLFFARVVPILESIDAMQFEIVCVNDGSADDTLAKLVAVSHADARVRVRSTRRPRSRPGWTKPRAMPSSPSMRTCKIRPS